MTKKIEGALEASNAAPNTENEIKALERGFRVLDARWDGRSTLSVEETGEVLGLSRSAAYAAANSGDLPVVRVGRRMVVPRFALEKLLLQAS